MPPAGHDSKDLLREADTRAQLHPDTPDDPDGKAIVRAMPAMARHLRLRVVAEGVETRAQADFLAEHDCDSMQGYLFARPAPFADLLDKITSA